MPLCPFSMYAHQLLRGFISHFLFSLPLTPPPLPSLHPSQSSSSSFSLCVRWSIVISFFYFRLISLFPVATAVPWEEWWTYEGISGYFLCLLPLIIYRVIIYLMNNLKLLCNPSDTLDIEPKNSNLLMVARNIKLETKSCRISYRKLMVKYDRT